MDQKRTSPKIARFFKHSLQGVMFMFRRTEKLLLSFLFFFSFSSFLSAEEFSEPIDIVYLWVNGNDPSWLKIKNHYSALHQEKTVVIQDACSDNRFTDHQELRYSLRSILSYAPFFRHIFIVTMNQCPDWLANHPQITIVDHKDIFKNLDDLPTFNSQAIECHLHRIPNLSEHFIYFNDDVLLGRPVTPSDFFTESGKVKVLFEEGKTVSPSPIVQATLYRRAWVNSNALLDAYFFQEERYRLCHAPFALKKSLIQKAEELFPFVFESNSSHKFRAATDYNITNGLLQYIWLYQGFAERGDMTNKMISMYSDLGFLESKRQLDIFLQNPLHTFCIQDCITGESPKTTNLLRDFFNYIFPYSAPWEKQEEEEASAI